MKTVSKTLHQLNVRQLKQLAKEFHVKTKSNRKSTLISNLLLQRGGYHRANRLPSITDDQGIRELLEADAEEDAEDEENAIIEEMEANNEEDEENAIFAEENANPELVEYYLRLVDLENELNERHSALEYISGRLMRGEIDVDDETFRKIRRIYLKGLEYQHDLEVPHPDETLIVEVEDFLVDTVDDYQNLKDRYYNL